MKRKPPVPLKCVVCGCTDDNACVDATGQPCHWAKFDPPTCSSCWKAGQLFADATPADAHNVAAFDASPERTKSAGRG